MAVQGRDDGGPDQLDRGGWVPVRGQRDLAESQPLELQEALHAAIQPAPIAGLCCTMTALMKLAKAKKAKAKPVPESATVIRLTAEHTLQRTAKRFVSGAPTRCPKCDSTYIGREPAFIHCRLCGKLARIADASLELQELWELRSGLRIAS